MAGTRKARELAQFRLARTRDTKLAQQQATKLDDVFSQFDASQPKTLQTVAPLALGAEQGIAVAMGALHVAASDLSTSSQQPTDHIGQEIQRRYTELADAVAGWHSVIDPTAAFTDLVGRAADTDQTLVSAPVDRAVTFLGRTAEQSAQMINDAVALAPDGPMTLRNRSLRPAAA